MSEKPDRVVLLGFPKCGQHSIQKYYADQGIICTSYEICWQPNAVEMYEGHSNGVRPVFVIRDMYSFLLSGYNYWGYAEQGVSFKDYLDVEGHDETKFGEQSPIARADFERWIKPFAKYNPIVHNIQDIPVHEHKTKRIKEFLTNEDVDNVFIKWREYCFD